MGATVEMQVTEPSVNKILMEPNPGLYTHFYLVVNLRCGTSLTVIHITLIGVKTFVINAFSLLKCYVIVVYGLNWTTPFLT